ncbi:hypothetical protein RBU00_00035 [Rhizobium sp. AN63]|uniref:hypothetical protein n=1 Tax=Rhizobium sp. AN63 TaxID=3035210 RepID=UPI0027D379BD|nr:hypothetical protein [Rhizobium sp. AN63]MDQ4404931.1 hypothetical protein [Rhizobium sp. AN63]
MRPARAGEEAELAEVGLASWRKGIKPHVNDAVAARIEGQNPFIPFIRQLGPQILVAEYQGKPQASVLRNTETIRSVTSGSRRNLKDEVQDRS